MFRPKISNQTKKLSEQPFPADLRGHKIGPYSIVKELGRGAFGRVYQALNENRELVALKFVDKVAIEKETNATIKEIRRRLMRSEGEIMRKCNSEHVVKCYDIYENKEWLIMAIEYCNDGDLQKQINNRNDRKIPEAEAIRILKHIIKGFSVRINQ